MKILVCIFSFIAFLNAANSALLNEATVNALNKEVDLVEMLFSKTNSPERTAFETKLCESLQLSSLKALLLYKQASFVFYYQNTNEFAESYVELLRPDALFYANGLVVHTNDNNRVPFSFIRVLDTQKTNTTVDLTILVAVLPLDMRPQASPTYHHRTFRFLLANDKKWKLTEKNK